MLKKVLHTGTAVPNLKEATEFYKSLGFEVRREFYKPDIDAHGVMLENGDATFELFEFHNLDHPQVEFIKSHIAIYSDDIENDVADLVKKGYKQTIPITEGVVLRFAYVQDSVGVNYEIATEKVNQSAEGDRL